MKVGYVEITQELRSLYITSAEREKLKVGDLVVALKTSSATKCQKGTIYYIESLHKKEVGTAFNIGTGGEHVYGHCCFYARYIPKGDDFLLDQLLK